MKRGFTLAEMVAVILIMALITITVLPSILGQVNNKLDDISEASKQAIYSSMDHYLASKTNTYPKISGSTYCIALNDLVQVGELTAPIKDLKTGNEIALNTQVKVKVNIYNDYEYCMVNIDEGCNSCS